MAFLGGFLAVGPPDRVFLWVSTRFLQGFYEVSNGLSSGFL